MNTGKKRKREERREGGRREEQKQGKIVFRLAKIYEIIQKQKGGLRKYKKRSEEKEKER